ncbi:hypothetical protein [Paenibacillus elgii]|uniref:hypothetical protein n=1 Tax=Paenibacillus elgii TaxID=189691 RepID=UPI00203D699A|nr:hypothetical protein [Paenibacillus elgii]MCM3270879.1 hypothetical protein [Paenibacillus elgii]
MSDQLNRIEQVVLNLAEKFDVMQQDASSLKQDVTSINQRLDRMEQKLDRIERSQAEDVVAILKTVDTKVEAFRKETRDNFRSFNRRVDSLERDVNNCMDRLDELEAPHN